MSVTEFINQACPTGNLRKIPWIKRTDFLRMLCVVQSQASHSSDVLRCQGREKRADINNLISDIVLAEEVAGDDLGLLCLANVRNATGEDGITIVYTAILRQEANQSLPAPAVSACVQCPSNLPSREALTEKAGMLVPVRIISAWSPCYCQIRANFLQEKRIWQRPKGQSMYGYILLPCHAGTYPINGGWKSGNCTPAMS